MPQSATVLPPFWPPDTQVASIVRLRDEKNKSAANNLCRAAGEALFPRSLFPYNAGVPELFPERAKNVLPYALRGWRKGVGAVPMMLAVDDLVPGVVLHQNVTGPSGRLLLASGVTLTEAHIRSLEKWGVVAVRVRFGAADEDRSETGPLPPEMAQEVKRQLREIAGFLEQKKSIPLASFHLLTTTLNSVIQMIFDHQGLLFEEVQLISHHDAHTYDHSWSVCVLSLALAREAVSAGLLNAPDYLSRLALGIGGLFHDLGKIFVPLEVLNKPGALSPEEFALMQEHPQRGVDALRTYESVSPMSRSIVLHHHQRWDGKGYGPASGFRLKGEEIPHLVRLVSVADAYDALVSDRPYRPGYLPGDALAVLRQAGGSYFDPRMPLLLSGVIPDYPRGSVVLTKNGWVVHVNEAIRQGEPLHGTVVGSLTTEGAAAVGEGVELASAALLCGGNSVPHLAQRLESLWHFRPTLEERPLVLHSFPPWDVLLRHHFHRGVPVAP